VGCAGRGITKTFETLQEMGLPGNEYDVVVCDVLGDIVCGGFAVPMRSGFAKEIYIVLSGEVMAMYAANNICRAVVKYSRNGISLGGLVANLRDVPDEVVTLRRFADAVGARLLNPIPRDETIQLAERASQTVITFAPESDAAKNYKLLFGEIEKTGPSDCVIPKPLDDEAFEKFVSDEFVNK
jgi:nitrogenase iron protein NifH